MSISRFTFLPAVVATALLASPAWAANLASTVAGNLRDSGTLNGYRVNVKAKAGTVWLEGSVSDEKQLAAALGVAESTPGVERVVNRLVVDRAGTDAPTAPLDLPDSVRSLAGIEAPRQALPREPVATREPAVAPETQPAADKNSLASLVGGWFAPRPKAEARPDPNAGPIQLVQAVAPPARGRQPQQGVAPAVARGGRPPMPLGPQPGRPLPAPSAGRGRPPMGRMAMRTSGMGDAMTLPGPGGHDYPVGDGQIVPGSVRYNEGYSGGGDPGMGGAGGGMAGGAPLPMGGTGVGMPPIPMRAQGPNMPNYAWPSYASYPNYAAVQYPTQYSPTAWPYIGPFYPYPQVPLGWRRVSLEWDDGWWWLDFDERHYHNHHR